MSTDIAAQARTLVALEAEKNRVLALAEAERRAARRRMLNALPAGEVLYPVVPQSVHSRCTYCWQPKPDLATGRDPRNIEVLRRLCGSCHRAITVGQPVELTAEQLAGAWEWLARQHINERAACESGTPAMGTGVTDTVIDGALRDLAPRLTPEQGRQAVEELEEMLLQRQDAQTGDVNYDELDPQWRDAAAYSNHCHGLVDDALRPLVGARS